MKINSTDSVSASKIKILVTGPSGSGKTSSIKSVVEAGYKPLVFSLEAGLLPLSGCGIDFVDGTRDDDGKQIPKEKRDQRLRDFFSFINTDACKKKYDTIVLDSLTEISQCLYDGLKLQFPERKDTLPLFGELSQRSKDVIKSFRDADYHVVCTCLTSIDKDETGKRFVALEMLGSISDKAPQFFDVVTYIRVSPDGKRDFVCNATDQIMAKDRSSKLSSVENSLGIIFQKILCEKST